MAASPTTATIAAPAPDVPEWTVGDRLHKARQHAGVDITEIAALLEVSERTIRNYEADRTPVKRPVLAAYSEATHVPIQWLVTGANTARYWGPDDDDFTESENDCYMLAA